MPPDAGRESLRARLFAPKLTGAILAVAIALAVSFVAILVSGKDAPLGFAYLFEGAVGGWGPIGESAIKGSVLVLTGLSVAIPFTVGLFNIGAEGQLIWGALAAAVVGRAFDLPAPILVPLCLGAAALAGGLWGALPGALKALRGVHEVISTILLNWVAIHLVHGWLVAGPLAAPGSGSAISMAGTAPIQLAAHLFRPFRGSRLDLGLPLSLAIAWGGWFLLTRALRGFGRGATGAGAGEARASGVGDRRGGGPRRRGRAGAGPAGAWSRRWPSPAPSREWQAPCSSSAPSTGSLVSSAPATVSTGSPSRSLEERPLRAPRSPAFSLARCARDRPAFNSLESIRASPTSSRAPRSCWWPCPERSRRSSSGCAPASCRLRRRRDRPLPRDPRIRAAARPRRARRGAFREGRGRQYRSGRDDESRRLRRRHGSVLHRISLGRGGLRRSRGWSRGSDPRRFRRPAPRRPGGEGDRAQSGRSRARPLPAGVDLRVLGSESRRSDAASWPRRTHDLRCRGIRGAASAPRRPRQDALGAARPRGRRAPPRRRDGGRPGRGGAHGVRDRERRPCWSRRRRPLRRDSRPVRYPHAGRTGLHGSRGHGVRALDRARRRRSRVLLRRRGRAAAPALVLARGLGSARRRRLSRLAVRRDPARARVRLEARAGSGCGRGAVRTGRPRLSQARTCARKLCPRGARMPKCSATVAPRSANETRSPRSVPCSRPGANTAMGTRSRVWSVPANVGSQP